MTTSIHTSRGSAPLKKDPFEEMQDFFRKPTLSPRDTTNPDTTKTDPEVTTGDPVSASNPTFYVTAQTVRTAALFAGIVLGSAGIGMAILSVAQSGHFSSKALSMIAKHPIPTASLLASAGGIPFLVTQKVSERISSGIQNTVDFVRDNKISLITSLALGVGFYSGFFKLQNPFASNKSA